jgi:archaellum component FlaG (FlaF/FlaG flagellin family)
LLQVTRVPDLLPFKPRSWLLPIVIAFVAMAWSVAGASAQGFMIKPMRLEVAPAAGRSVEVPLEIRNTAGGEAGIIDLRLVDLTQSMDGSWRLIEPSSGEDTSGLYSSLAWTTLSQPSISIAPLQPAMVMIRLAVPPDARGVYLAGVIAETPPRTDASGVAVRIRFLIPLIIQIAGRPVRQQVEATEAMLTFEPGEAGAAPRTVGSVTIVNEGRTLSRIEGRLTIERQTAEQWRPVTRIDIPERSIIPGATLQLGDDLGRKVPSGTYRLRADLLVDGRRTAPLVHEINYQGDPAATDLAYDTALLLEPGEISVDVVPGATRTAVVSIENPGTDPVIVSMTSSTPVDLGGVEMGNVRGVDLSAEPWTQIRPAEFTLRPGGRQNVRVISQIPREGVQFPNYYADLVLTGKYADGESAGETRSTVHLANSAVDSVVDGMVEVLTLSESEDPGTYVVQSRLTNIGNVHVAPLASVSLLTAQGTTVRQVELTGEDGMLLPLAKRNYGAELSLLDLEPGFYAMRASFRIAANREIVRQQVLRLDAGEVTGPDGPVLGPVVTIDPLATDFPTDALAPAGSEPTP